MFGAGLAPLTGLRIPGFGVVCATFTAGLRRVSVVTTAMMGAASRREEQNEEQGQK